MSAPWPSLVASSLALGICGLGGLAYGAIVVRRVAAALLRSNPQLALFVIGAASLALLFIGIHNAWDTVTHIVVSNSGGGTTKTE